MRVHPYFIENKTNIQIIPTKLPFNVWNKLVPSQFGETIPSISSQQGVNVTSTFQDPRIGAQDLLCKCGLTPSSSSPHRHLSKEEYEKTSRHLEQCLSIFQDAIADDNSPALTLTFRAEIQSSRGMAGTKCPKWHMDNVPLRLLLSLEGPGVCYLQPITNPQNAQSIGQKCTEYNGCDCEKYSNHEELQAKAGEVALLLGKRWEEVIKKQYSGGMKQLSPLQAVVHKSPTLLPLQGRVLLKVDVVMDEDHFF